VQGLSQISQNIGIIIVDPNPDALELAKQRFDEMPSNPHVQSVRFIGTQENFESDLDLAIIATNADVRRKVIENLLIKVQIKYLILEKVVFQSVKDFEEVILLLEEKKINAWVNCPRRMFPFFRNLRKETNEAESLRMSAKGSNWGLASNAIHMLDLLAFLSGQTEISIDITNLDDEVYESKRKGFIELGGKLLIETARGDKLELVDERKQKIPFQISIEDSGKHINIDQQRELIRIYSNETVNSEKSFHMPPQSEMTAAVAEQILESGNSDLASLDESYLLHRPMLAAFNQHLSTVLDKSVTICPIT